MKEDVYPERFTIPEEGALGRLRTLPRTGWLQWNIKNPETVYEHTLDTRRLAIACKKELGLTKSELEELLAIIEVHDWPEAIVGDEVVLGDEIDTTKRQADKHRRELEAMRVLTSELADGAQALSYFERYEAGSDRVARLARELDKLQAVLQAARYEKQYQKEGLLVEFCTYTEEAITDPYLRSLFILVRDNQPRPDFAQ